MWSFTNAAREEFLLVGTHLKHHYSNGVYTAVPEFQFSLSTFPCFFHSPSWRLLDSIISFTSFLNFFWDIHIRFSPQVGHHSYYLLRTSIILHSTNKHTCIQCCFLLFFYQLLLPWKFLLHFLLTIVLYKYLAFGHKYLLLSKKKFLWRALSLDLLLLLISKISVPYVQTRNVNIQNYTHNVGINTSQWQ